MFFKYLQIQTWRLPEIWDSSTPRLLSQSEKTPAEIKKAVSKTPAKRYRSSLINNIPYFYRFTNVLHLVSSQLLSLQQGLTSIESAIHTFSSLYLQSFA